MRLLSAERNDPTKACALLLTTIVFVTALLVYCCVP